MKKLIITLGIILTISVFKVNAQKTNRNELRAGYSDATWLVVTDALGEAIGNAGTAVLSGSTFKNAKSKSNGVIEAGYRNQLTKDIKIGIDVGYLKIDKTSNFENNTTKAITSIKRHTDYLLVMPMAEFSYLKTSVINLYATAGAGAIFYKSKEVENTKASKIKGAGFAFQIDPIGLRVGKQLGAFLELGFGYKGIGTAGISYKF